MHLRIIQTEDGSTSIYDEQINESYHSTYGAINESMHVFIEAGLNQIIGKDSINLLEIGLGTGLNVLLTSIYSEEKNIDINYFAIEPYPIEESIYKQMNFEQYLKNKSLKQYFTIIHKSPWGTQSVIQSKFKITKLQETLELYLPPSNFFNLIYFDAFSPDVQPELWTLDNFTKIYKSLQLNGILVTYCAKGQVRRNLENAGFTTERIPGPKGKREMLRATKH